MVKPKETHFVKLKEERDHIVLLLNNCLFIAYKLHKNRLLSDIIDIFQTLSDVNVHYRESNNKNGKLSPEINK